MKWRPINVLENHREQKNDNERQMLTVSTQGHGHPHACNCWLEGSMPPWDMQKLLPLTQILIGSMEQRLLLFISAQITCDSHNWERKTGAGKRVMGHADRGRAEQVLRDDSHWEWWETSRCVLSFKHPSDSESEATIIILIGENGDHCPKVIIHQELEFRIWILHFKENWHIKGIYILHRTRDKQDT